MTARPPCCLKTASTVLNIIQEHRVALTNDDVIEVGKALLPYLRPDLTAAELGACSYNATMALRRAQHAKARRNIEALLAGETP